MTFGHQHKSFQRLYWTHLLHLAVHLHVDCLLSVCRGCRSHRLNKSWYSLLDFHFHGSVKLQEASDSDYLQIMNRRNRGGGELTLAVWRVYQGFDHSSLALADVLKRGREKRCHYLQPSSSNVFGCHDREGVISPLNTDTWDLGIHRFPQDQHLLQEPEIQVSSL